MVAPVRAGRVLCGMRSRSSPAPPPAACPGSTRAT